MTEQVKQYIGGEFAISDSKQWLDVTNPATNEVIAQVPCATESEMNAAIASATETFKRWKEVAAPERARLMLRYQHLLKEQHDELAILLSSETGKTLADAKGDIWRGIEVVEQAANICSSMMGETVENVATNIDGYSYIQPLGVCAGITPFNFPAMIPLWMFPMAIACGNTFILKPSEQVPLTAMKLAELFEQAGAPKGVLQVVHGTKEQVDRILTDPVVRAISFVGSVPVGEYIYKTGTDNLKRVQSFAGAKNHMVIMPDADKQQVGRIKVVIANMLRGRHDIATARQIFRQPKLIKPMAFRSMGKHHHRKRATLGKRRIARCRRCNAHMPHRLFHHVRWIPDRQRKRIFVKQPVTKTGCINFRHLHKIPSAQKSKSFKI